MKRIAAAVLCSLFPVLVLAQDFAPGEVLVKVRPGQSAQAAMSVGASRLHVFDSGAQHWRVADTARALAALRRRPDIAWAEPNPIQRTQDTPNDPGLPNQWAWTAIHAFDAWTVTHGSASVIVADIDTGLDYRHADLAGNLWTNPGEIPGNGLDDDGNGFVDDLHGYDFYGDFQCGGAFGEDGDPMDENGHGTHTAGTIGAVGNNGVGVTGTAWSVSIMGVRFLGESGGGTTADAVRAIDYARRQGASIISASWGCGPSASCYSQALYDAIAMARDAGILFIAAAGNNAVNTDLNPNFFPADFDLDNIISVAASDQVDGRASFSNYGPATVDLAAPGVGIYSTFGAAGKVHCEDCYFFLSGTSMATPHVAGAAALLKALHPEYGYAALKSAILSSVDALPQWSGVVGSGGRLNLARTVGAASPTPTPTPAPTPHPCVGKSKRWCN